MTNVLVDTNLLIYSHDPADPAKQQRAIEILDHLHSTGAGRLSTQSLAEFFAVAIRGKKPLLSVKEASQQLQNLSSSWLVLHITPLIVIDAARGVQAHKFAYWDSQLWATARLNQIPVIFTEDFDAGATIEGIRFVNPFSSGFQLSDW
jgi:predicted nucleic acid-binding protein